MKWKNNKWIKMIIIIMKINDNNNEMKWKYNNEMNVYDVIM